MNYSEYQICSTENSLTDSWKYMGNWSKDNGMSLVTSKLFGNEFIDFNNATLKVAALPVIDTSGFLLLVVNQIFSF